MDTEDRLLLEVDVFLSKALSENLVVLQYPVRPGNRDWNDVQIKNAAIKPKNQMLRLEVGLDTYSDQYCPSKGEQIALNTDGQQESTWHVKEKDKDKDKSLYFKDGMMDKIVLESSTPCIDTKTYAVAILQDKELHITPLQAHKGVLQMRPSYAYFDKQDKLKRDKTDDDDDSEEEEKEPKAKQVTVKFTRQETEVAKKAREKSFATISQKISSEQWYDAMWKHPGTDHADLERLKLFSATTSDGSALTLNPDEYVRVLVPPAPVDEADVAPSKRPSVEEQIKEVLFNAKLMTFNDLRSFIRTDKGEMLSEEGLVSVLSGVACCVRGLWTPRSSALYTRQDAVPPHLLAAARDHVLYLFTKHTYIDRRKVQASIHLPPLEVLSIISSVAKYDKRTGWELLVPPDLAFENRHPDVIKRQNHYWEARHKKFIEMIIGEISPRRQRKKSQRDSVSSDTMLSPKQRRSVSEEDSDKKRSKSKSEDDKRKVKSEEESDKKRKNKSATGVGKRTRHPSGQDAT